jgi:UDP-N-acetyl-2-amino-2-deoxyglucuronate dehydrogenase
MLTWVFGEASGNTVHMINEQKAGGLLKLQHANVRWFLSVDYLDIPEDVRKAGKRTFRSLLMGDQEIEFSDGFTDLHTEMYREIIAGRGFGLMDARESIDIVYHIRNDKPVGLKGDYHPILKTIRAFS